MNRWYSFAFMLFCQMHAVAFAWALKKRLRCNFGTSPSVLVQQRSAQWYIEFSQTHFRLKNGRILRQRRLLPNWWRPITVFLLRLRFFFYVFSEDLFVANLCGSKPPSCSFATFLSNKQFLFFFVKMKMFAKTSSVKISLLRTFAAPGLECTGFFRHCRLHSSTFLCSATSSGVFWFSEQTNDRLLPPFFPHAM